MLTMTAVLLLPFNTAAQTGPVKTEKLPERSWTHPMAIR